ncbi:MAG: hypothetical protein EOO87_01935 [Pedobacter sp.]|nr:MAG: hypothetical protein EOO87_01935 [Pedobacter sp.]
MLNKITKSLAFRLPHLYKILLRHKKLKSINNTRRSDQVVLMMTGRGFIEMTRLCLFSIANTWADLPKIIIISDGSLSKDEIYHFLVFWKGELFIEAFDHTLEYHKAKNRFALINYANAHPFGKKLAIILYHAALYPVVWVDSDILFYKSFSEFIPKSDVFGCGGSEDFDHAYHQAVISQTGNNLYEYRKFNAGLLFVHGDSFYDDFNLERVIQSIYPAYDFCTEQSIFAHIASKSLGVIWNQEVIENSNVGLQNVSAMDITNKIGRHYTSNVRHLFWRDAFYLL